MMPAFSRIAGSGSTPVWCSTVRAPSSFACTTSFGRRSPRLVRYCATPSTMATRPSQMERPHGRVSSMMVEPARAPTPTCSCSCASAPRPEKSIIAPSGTAPRIGRTMLPTMPATDGTNRRSSDPSESIWEAR
eukprot:scaffold2825_cov111-Isochrysis_galbana.AAC.3